MKLFAGATVMVAMLGGQSAFAQPPSVAPLVQTLPVEATQTQLPMAVEAAEPDPDAPLNLEDLSDLRGGDTYATQQSNQNLNAVNSGNSVNAESVGSGAVNLNSNAFNGYDGVGNFVINTGHNNNLMGSISVNVMVTPQ